MHDVRVIFNLHELIDLNGFGLTDAINIVSAKVHEHDVLGAFLGVRQQLLGQCGVFVRGFAALTCACDRVGIDDTVLDLGQHFGGRADDDKVFEVDIKHVWRRVEGPEVAIHVEGVELGRAGETLGRHGLEDVTFLDVVLELGDKAHVTVFADVRNGLLVEVGDRWLWDGWDFGFVQEL